MRAIGLYPEGWTAWNNLAALEREAGNIDRAYGILEPLIQTHSHISKINLNMGLVLEDMGRYEEAYTYIKRSLELDPMYSGAGAHLERVAEKIVKQREAQE